ncbi:MAG TPA: CinA family protein [Phenylobacterium sp.]
MAEALDPALPGEIDTLAKQVLQEACLRGLRLATAESCTGGLLASLLTDVPGSSHAFERGFVVYTEDAKHELLGVGRELIEAHTAVSEPVARAMAEGALAGSRADIAVSITGYADTSTDPAHPGGLVHFAAARTGQSTVHRKEEFGPKGRAVIRIACLRAALELFRDQLVGKIETAAQ